MSHIVRRTGTTGLHATTQPNNVPGCQTRTQTRKYQKHRNSLEDTEKTHKNTVISVLQGRIGSDTEISHNSRCLSEGVLGGMKKLNGNVSSCVWGKTQRFKNMLCEMKKKSRRKENSHNIPETFRQIHHQEC